MRKSSVERRTGRERPRYLGLSDHCSVSPRVWGRRARVPTVAGGEYSPSAMAASVVPEAQPPKQQPDNL